MGRSLVRQCIWRNNTKEKPQPTTAYFPGHAITLRALLPDYTQDPRTLRDVDPSTIGDALVQSLITTVQRT